MSPDMSPPRGDMSRLSRALRPSQFPICVGIAPEMLQICVGIGPEMPPLTRWSSAGVSVFGVSTFWRRLPVLVIAPSTRLRAILPPPPVERSCVELSHRENDHRHDRTDDDEGENDPQRGVSLRRAH